MHSTILPTLLILATAISSAIAAPGEFKPAATSSKATWFAHLDLVSLRSSEIGKQLIGKLDGESKRQLRQFERMLNFHPINDLDSVTVYGTSKDPEKAIALIRGKFDTQRLTGVAEDANDYKTVAHGKSTIHSWKDGSKRIYASIVSENLVAIGPELELLRTALDVTNGDGAALDPTKIFGHLEAAHAPILIASANLSALGTLDIDSSLVRKIQSVYISAGEKDGKLLGYAAVKTADKRSAKLVDNMLHGVLALAEASDEVPQEIIDAFETKLIEADEHGGISLTLALPIKQFETLVAKIAQAAEGLK